MPASGISHKWTEAPSRHSHVQTASHTAQLLSKKTASVDGCCQPHSC